MYFFTWSWTKPDYDKSAPQHNPEQHNRNQIDTRQNTTKTYQKSYLTENDAGSPDLSSACSFSLVCLQL